MWAMAIRFRGTPIGGFATAVPHPGLQTVQVRLVDCWFGPCTPVQFGEERVEFDRDFGQNDYPAQHEEVGCLLVLQMCVAGSPIAASSGAVAAGRRCLWSWRASINTHWAAAASSPSGHAR